ncbi:MAG: aminoglycoside adenylyltransferase domain-containing protein [Actinomycetota bacterium]
MVLLANEVLEGPPAQTIFEPVPRLDYVRSMVDGIEGLLADLEGDERNVVLTLARIWCSLATDEIRSKDEAAEG